jgi:hypothetical protein
MAPPENLRAGRRQTTISTRQIQTPQPLVLNIKDALRATPDNPAQGEIVHAHHPRARDLGQGEGRHHAQDGAAADADPDAAGDSGSGTAGQRQAERAHGLAQPLRPLAVAARQPQYLLDERTPRTRRRVAEEPANT